MAVTAFWYGNALLGALNKEVDWNTDVIRVALCTVTYTPDQDVHDFFDDITNEVVGTGYVAEGAQLTTPTAGYTAGTNVIKLDGDNVTWAASSITARYAIIYVDTGTPATSRLLGYVDFGENKTSSGGDFTITWHADGIFTITVS